MGKLQFRSISYAKDLAECGELCELVVIKTIGPSPSKKDAVDACERCRIIQKASIFDCCIDCYKNCCPRCIGKCTQCKEPVCSNCWPYHRNHCEDLRHKRALEHHRQRIETLTTRAHLDSHISSLFDEQDYERERARAGGIQIDI